VLSGNLFVAAHFESERFARLHFVYFFIPTH
jgi:hypothetical protein